MSKFFRSTSILFVSITISCSTVSEKNENLENQVLYAPWKDLDTLFHDVQMAQVFPDSKTFVDCKPKKDILAIKREYEKSRTSPEFDIRQFVLENFELPRETNVLQLEKNAQLISHLEELWPLLTRKDSAVENANLSDTRLILPKAYVVPGGRFREIYYWDSYFTMIGLGAQNKISLIESMLDNFSHLIASYGHVPNGNRTYYLSRSQPPFLGHMINLYRQYTSDSIVAKYLPFLQMEYDFWQADLSHVSESNPAAGRTVFYKGYYLNRYWDEVPSPRPESYREDILLAYTAPNPEKVFRNLRSACESGWDFSTRWLSDPENLTTIRTTDIIPIDLNSLIYTMELTLSDLYKIEGNEERSNLYLKKAEIRYNAINELFWNAETNLYQDIIWTENKHSLSINASGFYPLFCKVSTQEKAISTAKVLLTELLKPGGIQATNVTSGQQWDAPNGWAPHQWIASMGLKHYGMLNEGQLIAERWCDLNLKVYRNTGKMMEKYNVQDTTLLAGGGEYPTQDGFGWSNGVYIGFLTPNVLY